MQLPMYQVDAFTDELFAGNPAAVCPLSAWLPDETLHNIAQENNLSETAFTVPAGAPGTYALRWFTPTVEVDLCGHATLAAAWVHFFALGAGPLLRFQTRSGELIVQRHGDMLELDFPSVPPHPTVPPPALAGLLGRPPQSVHRMRPVHGAPYYLAVYEQASAVAGLSPDTDGLRSVLGANVIVTAPADSPGLDFVSRFFAPASGVPEDPVTGSAHCSLAPYWSDRLGKTRLVGRQISARGGTVVCVLDGDRVRLQGQGVLYLRGEISLPDPAQGMTA
jgi:PhzF family phenazine biosynthesis protein